MGTTISLQSLSVLVTARQDHLMGAFKAYFDESGKEDDPQHDELAVGGYIADWVTWRVFEEKWQKALADESVAEFHMKNFAHSCNGFEEWKGNEERRTKFIKSLVDAIASSGLKGYPATIRLNDLRRFNSERKTSIEALPLAMYLCLLHIQYEHPSDLVEIVFDKLDKPSVFTDEVHRFATTHHGINSDRMINVLDGKDLNSGNVLPIQAADFLAWEARKHHTRISEWFATRSILLSNKDDWMDDLKSWMSERGRIFPDRRKSFSALLEATPFMGRIWDYTSICELSGARRDVW
jgi:Protein of unknown function (DUF3800)